MGEPCYSLYTEEITQCQRVPGNPWPQGLEPRLPIPSEYTGPYPTEELNSARAVIMNELLSTHSLIVERVKPKMGLTSAYGYGMVPPPVKQQSTGATESSDNKQCLPVEGWGHADKLAPPDTETSDHSNEIVTQSDNKGAPNVTSSSGTSQVLQVCKSDTTVTSAVPSSSTRAQSNMTSMDLYARYSMLYNNTRHQLPSTPTPSFNISPQLSQITPSTLWVPIFQVFRCDFCSQVASNQGDMQRHMIAARHMTASLYKSDIVTGNIVAVERITCGNIQQPFLWL